MGSDRRSRADPNNPKLAAEAADNGLLDLATAQAIGSVKGAPTKGTRLGRWLTRHQAQEPLEAPGTATTTPETFSAENVRRSF